MATLSLFWMQELPPDVPVIPVALLAIFNTLLPLATQFLNTLIKNGTVRAVLAWVLSLGTGAFVAHQVGVLDFSDPVLGSAAVFALFAYSQFLYRKFYKGLVSPEGALSFLRDGDKR